MMRVDRKCDGGVDSRYDVIHKMECVCMCIFNIQLNDKIHDFGMAHRQIGRKRETHRDRERKSARSRAIPCNIQTKAYSESMNRKLLCAHFIGVHTHTHAKTYSSMQT